jgi:hypothetical protein
MGGGFIFLTVLLRDTGVTQFTALLGKRGQDRSMRRFEELIQTSISLEMTTMDKVREKPTQSEVLKW